MLPKLSLLEELRKGGYEASLITTYNAYLPFYEDVVLRRLVHAGVRHNVLLMDARQYAASIGSHPPRLAGRHYTLAPLRVAGAFHPKLIFLAGKNKGLIAIGSHNLTLAGFGFNRELTNVVRIEGARDAAGIAIARDLWGEIDHWLANYAGGVPAQVVDMVHRVAEFAPWLKAAATPDDNVRLLAGRPGRPLWDQLEASVEGEAARVFLTGAFFDQGLRFLERVKADLRPGRFAVAVDPATVELSPGARALNDVSLVRADSLGIEEEGDATPYLHAKGLLIEQKNGDVLFASGSANPSAPAWLADANGNVELMLIHRGDVARTTAEALGFTAIPGMPALDESDWRVIAENARAANESPAPGYRIGVAVVEGSRVLFDHNLVSGLSTPVARRSG